MSESPDPPSDPGSDTTLDPKLRAIILLLVVVVLAFVLFVVIPSLDYGHGDVLALTASVSYIPPV